jgi:peptidoglycan/LPS O-acetylase OafA/YrhL
MSLAYLQSDTIDWRRFFSARFARIYPLYAVTSVATAAVMTLQGLMRGQGIPDIFSSADILREIALATAMPLVGSDAIWNDPTWSISVEWWSYILLFPALAYLQSRISARAATIVVAASLGIMGYYLSLQPSNLAVVRGWPAFGRAVVEFAAGWVVFRLWREDGIVVSGRLTDALLLVTMGSLAVYGIAYQDDPWFLILLFPALVLGLASSQSFTSCAMSHPVALYLGEISYSIYLAHTLVLYLVQYLLIHVGGYESVTLWIVLVCGGSIGLSSVTYAWVEKPMRDYLRNLLERRGRASYSSASVTSQAL